MAFRIGESYPELISASFSRETWERIYHALDHQIHIYEAIAIEENAGDREWQEIEDIRNILKDIQIYILAIDKPINS